MKRVTLFAGHYGSGKTNVAVNYALHLRSLGLPVVIADLDVVNPYFRTKDSEDELTAHGIPLISSDYAGSNVDFPALPGSLYSLFDDKSAYAVLDIGGDDRGAFALGRYRDMMLAEDNYDMFFVINMYRPLTRTPEQCIEIKEEIEAAAGINFTGIVNNSNLGSSTTVADVLASSNYANLVSSMSGLPIVMTTVMEGLSVEDAFPLKLQKKIFEEDS
ncbi:MAG: hypothetical protein Q4F70_06035 [Clostridia bacterium]|nr:hypothetical protein [Clostridia bacterium]